MITIRKGDMFAEDVDVLVNPVNCVGVMGAGLALEFKRRWPAYFSDYTEACHDRRVTPGMLHWWHSFTSQNGHLCIISFPTKFHWRDKSKIRDIARGLHELGNWLNDTPFRSDHITQRMAIPALGCGLGGLDWNEVRPLMTSMLNAHAPDVDIRLYEPR